MPRDLQDIGPAPAGVCVLVEDNYNVFKGLVDCSDDIESGVLEPFETNQYYKAYLLNISNNYYSTQIQVRSFDSVSSYIEWHAKENSPVKPSAFFICVDVEMSETELQEYLDKMDNLNLKEVDTKSLLLFGLMPCSRNNVDHPKAQLIQKFIEKHFVETVRFEPNKEELEELEENREIYGIKRVWELLCVADWPTKIMKKGAGCFDAINRSNGVPSSASQKCNVGHLKADARPSHSQQDAKPAAEKNLTDGMEPTLDDEHFIYSFLMGPKTIPEPEFKVQKIPPLSLQYLKAQRERALKGMAYPRDDRLLYHPIITPSQIKNLPHYSTEGTFADRSNLNTQMSIINTVKQFEPDKERAGSTSINFTPTTHPVTSEQVSIVQQSKKKKKGKKQESPEQPTNSELEQQIRKKIEPILDGAIANEETKPTKESVQGWSAVKDKSPNNEKVHVANQLTKTYIKESDANESDLKQHLADELDKMKIKPETKKDK